tara:strand:- start:2732 stop:3139 length:408 start_codon:yes stop_codon:yes gene_type:complete
MKSFTSATKRLTNGLTLIGSSATNANKRLTCIQFYEIIFEVMRDEMNNEMNEMTTDQRVNHTPMFATLDPELNDFEVTHASQDEVNNEHEELGTTLEEGWFDEGDEQTTDMSQLSPAFREIFNEYSDEEEDDDNA